MNDNTRMGFNTSYVIVIATLGEHKFHENLASSPGLAQKIAKRAWSHLHKFLYVLCQQCSLGVDESHSSTTNY